MRVSHLDKRSWFLLPALVGVYLFINMALPEIPVSAFLKTYVFQPLVWLAVAGAALALGRYRTASKMGQRSTIIQLAAITGFFQVILFVIAGLFTGFGQNPSSATASGILINFFFVGSMLAGLELSRAWLVNNLGRHTSLVIVCVSLLFTVLYTPLGQLTGLRIDLQAINYVDSTLIPLIASNLLASFLALLGGPLASLAYMGLLQAFWWFVPILPDLSWALKGLIGTGVPIVALVVIRGYYAARGERRQVRNKEGSMGSWVVTAVFSVVLIWFAVGLFPIKPSLVASGSMSPAMQVGDIAIVARVPVDSIKVGDVINYQQEKGIFITHRVIGIEESEGNLFFITKGDANNAADSEPVAGSNVTGRVIFNIGKIGWVAIVLKGMIPD